jgi:growth arrest-specific protein 8
MQKLRQKMEEERAARIKQIEEKKDLKIQQLTKEHSRKYNDIKNYYSDITATNLEYIRTLKGEINKLQSKEDHDKKLLQQIERENKSLTDPLKSLKEEIVQLTAELHEYDKLKRDKEEIKKTIEKDEELFRKMEYEYEVKLQEFKFIEREKELLYKKFIEAIYEIERKTGLEVK